MKTFVSICLLSLMVCLPGCGDASVKGKPALKSDGEDGKAQGPSHAGMKGNPQMMVMGLDKNKDGKITKDEIPDGGLDDYDYDKDGVITQDEVKRRTAEISKGGLKSMEQKTEGKKKTDSKESKKTDDKKSGEKTDDDKKKD